MAYTVLARKFRSQTFDEVVGQPAIVETLKHAIEQDRIHHGYLFCGTRGVGKTSMARILAKALNCHAADAPTTQPCGKCDSCINVARGEDVDVVEIDAASNTGVDNIRELRTNAIYRPARSRFKIYIIDEVHMLSTGAFNALLKTLEEPPGHVKFIFATTESHKVPATILSRVQRFDFKSIQPAEIAEQLRAICKAEGVKIDDASARRLSRLANGSMRDALSLLDQVLSMAGKSITGELVDRLFPAAHDELSAALIDKLADRDPAGALDALDRCLGEGVTLDLWCSLMIQQLRDLMVLRVCGAQTDLVDVPAGLRERLVQQAARFDGSAFVHMISVLEELRRSVKSSGAGRALVEAAVIRMAESSNFADIETLLSAVQASSGGAAPSQRTAAAPPRTGPAASPPRPAPASHRGPAAPPSRSAPASGVPGIKKNAPAVEASASSPQAGPYRSSAAQGAPPAAAPTEPGRTQASSDAPAAPLHAPRPAPPSAMRRGPAPAQGPAARPPASVRKTTSDDLRAANAEPLIREALDLFGGQVVEVYRASPAPAADTDSSDEET